MPSELSPSISLEKSQSDRLPTSWGRILAATGSIALSQPLDPTRVSVSFVPSDGSKALPVLVNGEPESVDEARASQILAEEEFGIDVELGLGNESAQFWTCDFSYVRCAQASRVF
jgi:glutamate N-acetyltransferase / amino-acid N-acetyltransferase